MSFAKGKCPVCATPASAKCRICGLESSPFDAAVRLGGGDLLIAAESTRRLASSDPLVVDSLNEVHWIIRMRSWAGAVIQAVEAQLRKARPDPKSSSDDERRWLSISAKDPMIVDPISSLTLEIVKRSADRLDAAAAQCGAKKIRRPALGEPEQTEDVRQNEPEKAAPSHEATMAFFETPEGKAYLVRHFGVPAAPADPAKATLTELPKFVPPYHLGGV